MAAAIAAARAGADVTLLEARPRTGGTVAHALIHTIGGLFDDGGERINPGLPSELIGRLGDAGAAHGKRKLGRAWVLDVCPDGYQTATQRWLAEEPRITVRTGMSIRGVRLQACPAPDRARLEAYPTAQIDAVQCGGAWIDADAVIDATGSAEVVRCVDPALLLDEPERAAGAD
jgi:glycine/D-amino acid oxidase-like deaminating enzyme